ncbi:oxidoreductase (plasmid) [Legionella adelaidensis]|uniref:Oxidoreductase n=1 Tax=Legionella adelaidensis TaxID=45056 RepID=A0A0W0R4V3_9GAMM|nr:Gfo/Idh/MocA family oxidoreductase [Legionella adelaidensis]KTC66066.1 oxidoreductase [Legionella adelaidensis]VEH85716.1 oxidoreductase [Legionella adelaidensis]
MINTICLFGGGRWARVLLGVLADNYPNIQIIWVSKNNYLSNIEWLKSSKLQNITLTSNSNIWEQKPQAAIIATSSYSHAYFIRECLSRKIPVLSEKPFCQNLSEAQELLFLSKKMGTPVGVNFEFAYASYLQDFSQYFRGISISDIEITWEDPFCEVRYGEKKFGDLYTPILGDSFQHCWSLLKVLWPKQALKLNSVLLQPIGSVQLKLEIGLKPVNILLSRRAEQRKRLIAINEGALTLDFSHEPGKITNNKEIKECQWRDSKPLKAAFGSFFEVIHNPSLLSKWCLYIGNCMEAIDLTDQASALLEKIQKQHLIERHPLSGNDDITRNLLIDVFLPKLAKQGDYHRAHDLEEQISFSNYVIDLLSQGKLLL